MAQLTEAELESIRDAFAMFDKNNDGHIHESELGEVMRSMGQNPTQKEIKQMIAEIDKDGNNMVEYPEFEAMMVRKGLKTADTEELEIKEAFKVFDRDNNGFITSDELRHLMINLGEPLTNEEVENMIQEADRDGNGKIDYQEFARLMSK